MNMEASNISIRPDTHCPDIWEQIDQSKEAKVSTGPLKAQENTIPLSTNGVDTISSEMGSSPVKPIEPPQKKEESSGLFDFFRKIYNFLFEKKEGKTTGKAAENPIMSPALEKEIDEICNEVKKALSQMEFKEKNEEEEYFDFEKALLKAYLAYRDERKAAAQISGKNCEVAKKSWLQKHKKLQEAYKELYAKVEKSSFFNRLAKASAPLYAAIFAAKSLLPLPLKLAAVAASTFLAIDEISGGDGKRGFAKFFAKNNEDKEQKILNGLDFLSFATSLGGTFGAPKGQSVFSMFFGAAIGAGKMHATTKKQEAQGKITENKHEVDKWSRKLNSEAAKIKKINQESQKMTKTVAEMLKQENQATLQMTR